MRSAIENFKSYLSGLSPAIDNLQKIVGLDVTLQKLKNKDTNKYIKVFGATKTAFNDSADFDEYPLKLISYPVNFYTLYMDNNHELTVWTANSEVVDSEGNRLLIGIGDILKVNWGNSVLYYRVETLPIQYADSVFSYTIKSMYKKSDSNDNR